MNSRHRYIALATVLLLAGYGAAQAQGAAAGNYTLAVGKGEPCTLTLAADGKATVNGTCARADQITRWHASSGRLELADGAGEIYAALTAKGDGYSGVSFATNHAVVLTPASQTAGQTADKAR
jgi:hypothetical protein